MSAEPEHRPPTELNALFRRLTRVSLLLEDFRRRTFAPFGLRPSDYYVLRALQLAGAPHQMSPTRLSDTVLRSTGGITQIVDRLEGDGLVARLPDPSDRRKIIVSLTDDGLRLVRRANRNYTTQKIALFEQLSVTELEGVNGAITELLDLFTDELDHGVEPVS